MCHLRQNKVYLHYFINIDKRIQLVCSLFLAVKPNVNFFQALNKKLLLKRQENSRGRRQGVGKKCLTAQGRAVPKKVFREISNLARAKVKNSNGGLGA